MIRQPSRDINLKLLYICANSVSYSTIKYCTTAWHFRSVIVAAERDKPSSSMDTVRTGCVKRRNICIKHLDKRKRR